MRLETNSGLWCGVKYVCVCMRERINYVSVCTCVSGCVHA